MLPWMVLIHASCRDPTTSRVQANTESQVLPHPCGMSKQCGSPFAAWRAPSPTINQRVGDVGAECVSGSKQRLARSGA